MYSRFLSVLGILIALTAPAMPQLRVCADPDNLPFSNRAGEGFENRIAEVIAHELHTTVHYEWQRMGRGFVRDVLNKRRCDVLLGVPEHFRPVLTTAPYYRSTYVFVTRKSGGLHLTSFDDPELKHMKIGVQIVSEEYAPPAQALGRRGLVANLVGFQSTGGDARTIIDGVLRKRVDAAVVWGPFAGYFGKPHRKQLELNPTPEVDPPSLPLAFSISMAVRKNDVALRDRLDQVLAKRKAEVDRILRSYGVPLLPTSNDHERSAD
jgi:mxaJ protein